MLSHKANENVAEFQPVERENPHSATDSKQTRCSERLHQLVV